MLRRTLLALFVAALCLTVPNLEAQALTITEISRAEAIEIDHQAGPLQPVRRLGQAARRLGGRLAQGARRVGGRLAQGARRLAGRG